MKALAMLSTRVKNKGLRGEMRLWHETRNQNEGGASCTVGGDAERMAKIK